MEGMDQRRRLERVARCLEAPDLVMENGVLFNAFTGEFLEDHCLWIAGGRIAYAGPRREPVPSKETERIDARGGVMLPGLIEAHTHVINFSGIEAFVRRVIPSGVTTVVSETIELASVAGGVGIEVLVRGLLAQPIRFYYTVAPLCGLIPEVEKAAPSMEELVEYLKEPRCLGLGEVYWANLFLEGAQGERVRELAAMTRWLGKRVEGHTAGASGPKLQAYTAYGVASCHEPVQAEEVLERIRLGYWVMIREGGIRKELDGVKDIFSKPVDLRRLILCTDSQDPEGFLEEGYLDGSVRRALELGIEPSRVYQMVTLNAAEHFRLDHEIGALAPGMRADVVLIPSPGEYDPRLILLEGRPIFRDREVLVEPARVAFPDWMFRTVRIRGLSIPRPPSTGSVRVMELVSRLVTAERIVNLDDPEETTDLLPALALDRTGGEEAFLGFLKGFGLAKGACGTTMCWDTVDMMVVGRDPRSMETAIGRLKELGGGAVYAVRGEVVAEFPAPLCGVASLESMETAAAQIRRLVSVLRENGVPWEKPLLTLNTLGTAAIPHLRLTHKGYVRLRDRAVLSLEI